MSAVLGIKVTWHDTHLLPTARHVMVSNHVTSGDLLILYHLPRSYLHLVSPALPSIVTKLKNHRVTMDYATRDVYNQIAREAREARENLPSRSSDQHPDVAPEVAAHEGPPVHLFAEGGMTNGRAMLAFRRGFSKLAPPLPVAPVALKVSHPWPF